MLTVMVASCQRKPGIYGWWGGRMDADTILRFSVDVGKGEQVYEVPFETYRAVFLYLKMLVSTEVPIEGATGGEDENATIKVATDGKSEGIPSRLATPEEQTRAIKEIAEQLCEYYSLVALGEQMGIAITDADKAGFAEEHQKTINGYVKSIRETGVEHSGTDEEYAEELYEKSLLLAGTTPEYYEFSYYRNLLETRIKRAIAVDLQDYLDEMYYGFRQVVILWTRGDDAAEQEARTKIEAARAALADGADIAELEALYGNSAYDSEVYFDSYGKIVGSSSGNTVNTITANAVKALEAGEYSDVMTGDDSEAFAYFAIYQRIRVDEDFVCGQTRAAQIMYQYPYVDAPSYSTYYSRYLFLLDAVEQNMICEPIREKVYRRIAVNTLY